MAKPEMSSFRIHVAEIVDGGLRHDVDLDPEQLALLLGDIGDEFRAGDGLKSRLKLNRAGDFVTVQGRVAVGLKYTCCRCLEEVETERSVRMRWTLLEEARYRKEVEGNEEVELTAEDLEVAFYSGEEIDLGDVVRQAVVLELEPYPVCPEQCRGEVASAPSAALLEDDIDPRWAPLLELKNRGN